MSVSCQSKFADDWQSNVDIDAFLSSWNMAWFLLAQLYGFWLFFFFLSSSCVRSLAASLLFISNDEANRSNNQAITRRVIVSWLWNMNCARKLRTLCVTWSCQLVSINVFFSCDKPISYRTTNINTVHVFI